PVFIDVGASTNNAVERATIYTPAVTMVAAWIKADTGVGPAMASGSQTYSGICADLPAAPTSRRRQMVVRIPTLASVGMGLAASKTLVKSSEPNWRTIKKIASENPKSP